MALNVRRPIFILAKPNRQFSKLLGKRLNSLSTYILSATGICLIPVSSPASSVPIDRSANWNFSSDVLNFTYIKVLVAIAKHIEKHPELFWQTTSNLRNHGEPLKVPSLSEGKFHTLQRIIGRQFVILLCIGFPTRAKDTPQPHPHPCFCLLTSSMPQN